MGYQKDHIASFSPAVQLSLERVVYALLSAVASTLLRKHFGPSIDDRRFRELLLSILIATLYLIIDLRGLYREIVHFILIHFRPRSAGDEDFVTILRLKKWLHLNPMQNGYQTYKIDTRRM